MRPSQFLSGVLALCVLLSLLASTARISAQSPYGATHEPLGPSSRKTPIVISEIMYKPAARADGLNLEYLEIYNSNPFFHDIGGYKVVGQNMAFTFPRGTIIPAFSFFVIAAAPADMQKVYQLGTNLFGPYTGSLKKSDTLQLLDEVGSILLTVAYSNESPWPLAADGTGHSLVLASPTYGEGNARAWDASELAGGSPGQQEPATAERLVSINEIASSSAAGGGFLELYNHSITPLEVSGCVLTDKATTNRFVIPNGTSIAPNGYLLFKESQLGFRLNDAGVRVYFLSADAQRVLDVVDYQPQQPGHSFGRFPDGADALYSLSAPTASARNGPVYNGDIVINELMYNPISGDNDDQYIELYNKGQRVVDLSHWQFVSGISFEFPAKTSLAPDSYLVISRNVTNLLAKYANLNSANTLGPFKGTLSHKADRVALAQPFPLIDASGPTIVTNTVYAVEDEVTYESGGRWGQWSAGGGSSLELTDPRSDRRLAANWADSDETQKSQWTTIEATGVLDNGANYESSILHAQIGLLDVGECLVDNIEILPASTGNNLVLNPDFETGLNSWSLQGCFYRSSLENSGFQSGHSLHIRCSDRLWTGDNSCEATLAANSLSAGQSATLRFRARWLHGWPEALLRLNGNWLEATGPLPAPSNLGTPGARNSRFVGNAGPAISQVSHNPAIPAAGQDVVVTARLNDPDGVANATLNYRLDPSFDYIVVPLKDDGTDGDKVAGDGIYSAIISGQAASQIVAFYISAQDSLSATSQFPALKNNNAPPPECVVMFGDATPGGNFGVYHLWITQTNANRWQALSDLSNESHDCTFVNGSRIIYNAQGRFAGSPYHQGFNTPYGNLCHYKWTFPDDDKFLGATSFNKIHQPGNGPGDDSTIQREQLANLFLRTLGVPWLNRRYVAVYVNGHRRGTLMEDAQTPDSDVVKERFPNDSNGFLYKMQPWFEFAPTPSGASIGFANQSWCTLNAFTTSGGVKKTARYRYNFLVRSTPDSANDFGPAFAITDAANLFGSSNYVSGFEKVADMENWMRVFAANHAAGNWDAFGCQNEQNLYGYMGTKETRYSLLMWDFNIVFGNSGSWSPGQNLFTVNGSDPNMANVYREPAFRRMYWRALQELVDGPLDTANSGALLDAKFAAFTASGVSVQNPSTIKSWLNSAHSSIASQIAAENTDTFTVNPATTAGNLATLTGTAPFRVKTILVNGVEWPLTWTSVIAWRVSIPLQPGTTTFSITGIDIHRTPVAGATGSTIATFTGSAPTPEGQIVINEIMNEPTVPGADYVELYNQSPNAYDLSGWTFDGLSYVFPPGSFIPSGGYLVLAGDRLPFAEAYGPSAPLFDTYKGTLSSTGERLRLLRPAAAGTAVVVSQVRYDSAAPWPASVSGSSLQLIDPTAGSQRVSNWEIASSNSVAPPPQWQYVTLTGKATKSLLLIGMISDGDAYVDDLKLVAGGVPEVGQNMIQNGDFESPLTGPWTVSANMANSTISMDVKHSGNASLHVIATSGGPTIQQAIWQNTTTLITNATYTLSYWYLPGSRASSFLIRLSGSSPNAGHIYSLQPFQLPTAVAQQYTPGFSNSVGRNLPVFPSVWINEVQPDPLNGVKTAAGNPSPWIELFNAGSQSVNLSGLYLSDDYSNLLLSPLPDGSSIGPGEFKIIFADGNASTAGELHTSFTLPVIGGSVALSRLVNAEPQVIEYLDLPALAHASSYGSTPDGQGIDRSVLALQTPGSSNTIPSSAASPGIVINEWMASNSDTINNPIDNQPDDWFELYNTTGSSVNLSGYFLSNTVTNREKFRIPDGFILAPHAFSIVWADNRNVFAAGALHTNFKLNKAGTSIGLFGPDGTIIDLVTFGAQASDVSQGRYPDGSAAIRSMNPTPGTSNVSSTTALNLASPGDQVVYPGQVLSVSLRTSGAQIGETLTFALNSPAPPGATIDARTGLFTWTVPSNQIAGTDLIQVSVTGDANPIQTATASFHVTALTLPALAASVDQNQSVLKFQTALGKSYRLQTTEDLGTDKWQTLGSDWTGTADWIEIPLDTNLAVNRFFRVLVVK